MSLLAEPQRYREPFPYFSCRGALPGEVLTWLEGLFLRELVWQHHKDSFYRAFLSDISELLDDGFRLALAARMRELTGLPLTDKIQATIQRMEPGQYAGPHTDRPLSGYEAARLIVQLNDSWEPDRGGLLSIHPDPQGATTTRQHAPVWNSAVGFVMGPRSYHSVEPARALRRTAVFNFWHTGNTMALSEWVSEQLSGMRFDFDGPLGELASDAETRLPEEDTYRAGGVAHLLQRWGFDSATVAAGYTAGLHPLSGPGGPSEVLFARWVQRLGHEDFDTALWSVLQPSLGLSGDERLSAGLLLAFPPLSG
ncbi:MAG: hypothetical protein ACI8S6_001996 [Myxococcota bacterium]|jgi:hypothetical protein